MPNESQQIGPGMSINAKGFDAIGYRLPTEAEWERACRAGTVTSRYFGLPEELLPKYEWYDRNAQMRTWPVGSLKPNDLGLFDMLGNILEWCHERYFGTAGFPHKEDFTMDAPHVVRGGSFMFSSVWARSAFRAQFRPPMRPNDVGFRPARTYP